MSSRQSAAGSDLDGKNKMIASHHLGRKESEFQLRLRMTGKRDISPSCDESLKKKPRRVSDYGESFAPNSQDVLMDDASKDSDTIEPVDIKIIAPFEEDFPADNIVSKLAHRRVSLAENEVISVDFAKLKVVGIQSGALDDDKFDVQQPTRFLTQISSLSSFGSEASLIEPRQSCASMTGPNRNGKQPVDLMEQIADRPVESRPIGRLWIDSMPPMVVFLICLVAYAVVMLSEGAEGVGSGSLVEPSNDNIFVPGGGFSGFWFTLGRLQSINDSASKTYFCYSSGCLGVVATLQNRTMNEMSDIAFSVQDSWKTGNISTHEVVTDFVEKLLDPSQSYVLEDPSVLSRLKIITTIPNARAGLKPCIRSPENVSRLREMLIQTAWIPLATSDSLWHLDSVSGEAHMDGAFSMFQHPKIEHHLRLPFSSPGIYLNALNVNLRRDKVEKYWNDGLSLGI